jgi:hypothetical protein
MLHNSKAERHTCVIMLKVSSSTLVLAAGLGGGLEPPDPKPTYLPPWLGGSPSGRDAFSCCFRAKKDSLLAADARSWD